MEVTFHTTISFYGVHVILKTITRTRTLKGGGFGLTPHHTYLEPLKQFSKSKTSTIEENFQLKKKSSYRSGHYIFTFPMDVDAMKLSLKRMVRVSPCLCKLIHCEGQENFVDQL